MAGVLLLGILPWASYVCFVFAEPVVHIGAHTGFGNDRVQVELGDIHMFRDGRGRLGGGEGWGTWLGREKTRLTAKEGERGSWVHSLFSHSALSFWLLAGANRLAAFSSAQYCRARIARQLQVATPLQESDVVMPE